MRSAAGPQATEFLDTYAARLTLAAARQVRNPATGETIEIAASRKLAFTAAKPLRDRLSHR